MTRVRRSSFLFVVSAALLLCQRGSAGAQTPQTDNRGAMQIVGSGMAIDGSGAGVGETAAEQIARAIAAGPLHVTRGARIVGTNAQGKSVVLREGKNNFTCQPGNPKVAGHPASCANAAALQWSADMAASKPKPTNTEPGIVFMFSGLTTSTTVTAGPQWLILWPFDPKATGLSATAKDTGAYIMWPDTPYAHLHIMGRPDGAPAEHRMDEQSHNMNDMMMDGDGPGSGEPADIQIARAIAAGPKHITDGARIMGTDAQGNKVVLREGNNGFSCQPGNPKVVAQPASCTSLNSKPAILYMVAGASQRSISDPNDKTSPALAIGPHWMIMYPFDPETSGLPISYNDTGAYIMWAATRSAHLHVMGAP